MKVPYCCKISPLQLQLCLLSYLAPAMTEACLRGRVGAVRDLRVDHYCLSKHKTSMYFPTVLLWENKNCLFLPIYCSGLVVITVYEVTHKKVIA